MEALKNTGLPLRAFLKLAAMVNDYINQFCRCNSKIWRLPPIFALFEGKQAYIASVRIIKKFKHLLNKKIIVHYIIVTGLQRGLLIILFLLNYNAPIEWLWFEWLNVWMTLVCIIEWSTISLNKKTIQLSFSDIFLEICKIVTYRIMQNFSLLF